MMMMMMMMVVVVVVLLLLLLLMLLLSFRYGKSLRHCLLMSWTPAGLFAGTNQFLNGCQQMRRSFRCTCRIYSQGYCKRDSVRCLRGSGMLWQVTLGRCSRATASRKRRPWTSSMRN